MYADAPPRDFVPVHDEIIGTRPCLPRVGLQKSEIIRVGGGEGMGPLSKTARAIDKSGLPVSLVIVTGRNAKLKAALKERAWQNPAFIYGFTQNMCDFMRAADVIVTKAGPGTIAEALNAELPIILYAKLPGQEDGIVEFVESEGVGVWAPETQDVVETLRLWINQPGKREMVIKNGQRVARPHAARQIARILGAQVGLTGQSQEATTI